MNRKGITGIAASETIFNIFRLIFLSFALVGIMAVVTLGTQRTLDIDENLLQTQSARLFYSPDCFTYLDNERSYPGIIDKDKFTAEQLAACLSREDLSAKITLDLGDGTPQTVYLDENRFQIDHKLCTFKQYSCLNTRQYYLVQDGMTQQPASLTIEMVMDVA